MRDLTLDDGMSKSILAKASISCSVTSAERCSSSLLCIVFTSFLINLMSFVAQLYGFIDDHPAYNQDAAKNNRA